MSVRNKTRNKHQIRTEETQAKILRAAEVIFSEQGFEKTQLEEIATRAGYTRGAIYAHYADKEDLFLALCRTGDDPVHGDMASDGSRAGGQQAAGDFQAMDCVTGERPELVHAESGIQIVCVEKAAFTRETAADV